MMESIGEVEHDMMTVCQLTKVVVEKDLPETCEVIQRRSRRSIDGMKYLTMGMNR